MVDMATYKLMHEDEALLTSRAELSDSDMNAEQVPPEPFALLLPATIRGYGFHNKKWSKLYSDLGTF